MRCIQWGHQTKRRALFLRHRLTEPEFPNLGRELLRVDAIHRRSSFYTVRTHSISNLFYDPQESILLKSLRIGSRVKTSVWFCSLWELSQKSHFLDRSNPWRLGLCRHFHIGLHRF